MFGELLKRSILACFLVCCSLAAFAGGKGLPVYMAREYTGLTMDEITDLATSALEGRKFTIMDIDKDDEGDVTIETHRKSSWFRGGPLKMHLRPKSPGTVRIVASYAEMTSAEEKIRVVWKDLDESVVKAGGCSWKMKRNGTGFVWCPGSSDWERDYRYEEHQARMAAESPVNESQNGTSAENATAVPNGSQSEIRYCIECGEEIPQRAKFCPHCGTKQPID